MTDPLAILYRERAHLVAHLAAIHPSTIGVDPDEPDWPVVYIDAPSGQLSWHLAQDDLPLFTHVPRTTATLWDGHTTEEKYARLDAHTRAVAHTAPRDGPAEGTETMISLLVIYTHQIDACRDWYEALGLDLVREQHGNGPVHYAATLPGGAVVELYPAGQRPPTGRVRLGLTLPANSRFPTGHRVLTDPDGRRVALTTTETDPR